MNKLLPAFLVAATLVSVPLRSSAGIMSLPAPRAGSICTFGPYHYGAIGNVSPGAHLPDRPGPHGNEIRQIYRVFISYRLGTAYFTGLAGFITKSFQGKYAFSPAGRPTVTFDLALWSVVISPPKDPAHLPIARWMHRIVSNTTFHPKPDQRQLDIMRGTELETAVSPCFSHDWDGVTGS